MDRGVTGIPQVRAFGDELAEVERENEGVFLLRSLDETDDFFLGQQIEIPLNLADIGKAQADDPDAQQIEDPGLIIFFGDALFFGLDPAVQLRGRYEITVTFFTISLRPLMPERYFCVTVIV
jgi:hypothetical protein